MWATRKLCSIAVNSRLPLIPLNHSFGAPVCRHSHASSTCTHNPASTYKHICVDTQDSVCLIGLDRPAKRNAINSRMAAEFTDAVSCFESDPDTRVGVIYGTQGTFCAGYDLAELAADTRCEGSVGVLSRPCAKPLVAALDGYALDAGLEIALWCDLRVMETTAVIGVFGHRFNKPLTDGATIRLPSLVGLSHALDIVLTGRAVSGAEAFRMGLVNRLVSCGTAIGEAVSLALSVAKFPWESMVADRDNVYEAAIAAEMIARHSRDAVTSVVHSHTHHAAKMFTEGHGRHGKFPKPLVPLVYLDS